MSSQSDSPAEIVFLRNRVEELEAWKRDASTSMQLMQRQLDNRRRLAPAAAATAEGSAASDALSPSPPRKLESVAAQPPAQDLQVNLLVGQSTVVAQYSEMKSELESARLRMKKLEEELIILRARYAVSETKQLHVRTDAHDLLLPYRAQVQQGDDMKALVIEATGELRRALEESGALGLPIVPHVALDLSLLLISLRDHARMAARKIRTLTL